MQRWAPTPKIVFDDAQAAWSGDSRFGVAWAPTWLAAGDLAQGAVTEVLREWRGKRSRMSIVRRDSRFTPKRTQAFIAYLKSKAASFN